VLPESPAAEAGVREGDIILAFNGQPLLNSAQLPPLVGAAGVDGTAELTILRDRRERTLQVKLAELPVEEQAQARVAPGKPQLGKLGLAIGPLTDEERQRLGLEDVKGVLVREVAAGPAKSAGIRAGDVIVMLAGQRVEDVASFRAAVEALPAGKTVAVLVQRRSGPLFLALRAPDGD
jgi:serine protease Do